MLGWLKPDSEVQDGMLHATATTGLRRCDRVSSSSSSKSCKETFCGRIIVIIYGGWTLEGFW